MFLRECHVQEVGFAIKRRETVFIKKIITKYKNYVKQFLLRNRFRHVNEEISLIFVIL